MLRWRTNKTPCRHWSERELISSQGKFLWAEKMQLFFLLWGGLWDWLIYIPSWMTEDPTCANKHKASIELCQWMMKMCSPLHHLYKSLHIHKMIWQYAASLINGHSTLSVISTILIQYQWHQWLMFSVSLRFWKYHGGVCLSEFTYQPRVTLTHWPWRSVSSWSCCSGFCAPSCPPSLKEMDRVAAASYWGQGKKT